MNYKVNFSAIDETLGAKCLEKLGVESINYLDSSQVGNVAQVVKTYFEECAEGFAMDALHKLGLKFSTKDVRECKDSKYFRVRLSSAVESCGEKTNEICNKIALLEKSLNSMKDVIKSKSLYVEALKRSIPLDEKDIKLYKGEFAKVEKEIEILRTNLKDYE